MPGDEQPGDEQPGDEQPGDEQPGDEQRGGVGPPAENPTSRPTVHEWIARRVAADEQMRRAGAARKTQES